MASKRFNNNRLFGFPNNRSSGFISNRSQGFVNTRSSGFFTNRSNSFLGNSSNRNITDARQVLQRRNIGQRLGGSGITDLSQKLRTRTGFGGRFTQQQRGGIAKQLYSARLNNNAGLNRLSRLQNNSALRNRSAFGMKYVAPNLARNTVLDQSKYIKVHRGGITVTAKQNTLNKQQKPVRDELEEMTLSDLPEPESVSFTRTPNHSLEERLNRFIPQETNDSSATVLISNLKLTVTEEDINELFTVVGQMIRAELLHPGAALVTYARKEDAFTAVEYYNNVTLDGMAMHCTVLPLDKQKTRPSITSRLGERTSSPLSASFLAPVATPQSSSFIGNLRGAGRQVQSTMPAFTHFTAKNRNTKFTVCLN